MSVDFEFAKWCESNALTTRTADILKKQDLDVLEAISLLDKPDIDELGLIKGQAKLLSKAVSGLNPGGPPRGSGWG